MSLPPELRSFLETDPQDVGCDLTMEQLHVYAESALRDEAQARREHPGIAAHLASCGPCAEDLAGLLAAVRGDARAP